MTCCSAIACSCLRSRRERGVSQACRLMGVHRSTFYRWKHAGRPPGARDAAARGSGAVRRCPTSSRSGRAADRGVRARPSRASARAGSRRGWLGPSGADWSVSPNGVYKTLVRHGLNTRAKRLALVAGYRAPFEPPREAAARAAHRQPADRASWSGSTASSSGGCMAPRARSGRSPRSTPTRALPGPTSSSHPPPGPTVEQTSALARRVAAELQHAGWRLRARAHR